MKCGECTACCDVFPINWLNKEANVKCVHSCNGCNIHSIIPKECSDYNCAFSQIDKCDEDLRPDKCGIIFERVTDRLFLGVVDPNMEVTEGFTVVLHKFDEKRPAVFMGKDHTIEEINADFQGFMKLRYGNLRDRSNATNKR